MNRRLCQIISELVKKDANLHISLLAKQFNVTEKTIRNNIGELNSISSGNKASPVIINTDGSIYLKEDISVFNNQLEGVDFYNYKLTKEERREILCLLLTENNVRYTTQSLADILCVSKNTAVADLDYLKKEFLTYNIEVKFSTKAGLYIEGKEENIRRMLFSVICPYAKTYKNTDSLTFIEKFIYLKLTQSINEETSRAQHIENKIRQAEESYAIMLTDTSFYKVFDFLAVMHYRTSINNFINEYEKCSDFFCAPAKLILKGICHTQNIPKGEIFALGNFLEQQDYIKPPDFVKNNTVMLQVLASKFLARVSEQLGKDLNADYLLFNNIVLCLEADLESLCIHLESTYEKNEIHMVKDTVQSNLKILFGDKIPEKERTEYIEMLVVASFYKKESKWVKCVLICSAGMATSNLIAEKLKTDFNLEVVSVLPMHNAQVALSSNADIIISTVDLADFPKEYIKVSPMLNGEDFLAVKNKIDAMYTNTGYKTGIKTSQILNACMPVLNTYFKNKNRKEQFISEISDALKDITGEREKASPLLHELIQLNHIAVNEEAKDAVQAIKKAAIPLLNSQCIKEGYVLAMLKNLEENGPYFVLNNFLALPHALGDGNVAKLGLSFVKFKEEVRFGDAFVKFVCVLCTADDKSHIKAFLNLCALLKNENFKEELAKASTPQKIYEIIKNYEYTVTNL